MLNGDVPNFNVVLEQYPQSVEGRHDAFNSLDPHYQNYLTNINDDYFPMKLAQRHSYFDFPNPLSASELVANITHDVWDEIAEFGDDDKTAYIIASVSEVLTAMKELNESRLYGYIPTDQFAEMIKSSPSTSFDQRLVDAVNTIRLSDEILPPSLRTEGMNIPLYTIEADIRGKKSKFDFQLRSHRRHPEAYYYLDAMYQHQLLRGGALPMRIGGVGFILAGGVSGSPNTMVITNIQGEAYTYKNMPRRLFKQAAHGLNEQETTNLMRSARALHPILSATMGEDWLTNALRQTAKLGEELGLLPMLIEMPMFNFNFNYDANLGKFHERYANAGFVSHVPGLYRFQE
jgi:hypothetical protein